MNTDIFLQLSPILSSIMPNYGHEYWQKNTELFGALPEFDSMVIVTLIGEIEETFDVEFFDEDISAENFATVEDIVNLIAMK